MAAVRSIFEYVSNKCYNGLYDAAKKYLDNHWHTMGLETRRVAEIKNAELIDATVQRVYVTDRPGNCIAFDIGLELEVCVSSADHHNDSDDTCYPWLRFSCEGDLSKGLDDWEIREITPYAKRNIPDNSMSDALVPDIRPAQYEKTATDFLEEYYPEALRITKVGEPPIYVDPYVLADRLGLSVLTHRINKEGSIFGQLFFLEADAEMYDIEHDKYVVIHVPAKTIVVDPRMYLFRNLGSVNNTIIHECVHWIKHRKVFMLEKLYNEKIHGITCEVVGGARANMSKQATEKMEQQANRLAPRIQMPAAPFKAKASDYIAKFMREIGAHHEIEVMEAVIQQLSVEFVVSKQAAKIRLVELGFESAVGTFNFIDGHYVPPHSYSKGAISRNQTFTIGKDFCRFKEEAGLTDNSRVEESVSPSPFDYRKNCLLYFPAMPPRQREADYFAKLAEEIRTLLIAVHGHALVLFTSYAAMSAVKDRLKQQPLPFPLFTMGRNAPHTMAQFKAAPGSVLFATGAAWEGFDFPGDCVSLLVIPRLPFQHPDALQEKKRKVYPDLRSFIRAVAVPEMQIKLKQGFGRAIRLETDTCAIAILDERAAKGSRYFRDVQSALPEMPVTSSIYAVERFIRRVKDESYFEEAA